MELNRALSGPRLAILSLAVLACPTFASAGLIDYTAIIQVRSTTASLGYMADDPNYWTPLLTSSSASALVFKFTLNGTSGTQTNLGVESSSETAFPDFGLVEGRDNTSSTIGSGSFNYLYLDNTNGTNPGATPQTPGNYFDSKNGLTHTSESAVWAINVGTLTIAPEWINPDGSTPPTELFVQSNHVYAGGDSSAFHSRFPSPVTNVTFDLQILSATPETTGTPEPASLWTMAFGVLSVGMLRWGKRSKKT